MLAGALLLDLLAGEYPNRLHPTVWMGVLTDKLLDFAPHEGTAEQFVFGVALVVAVAGLFAVPLWFGLQWLEQWNQGVYVLVGALALKPAFSIRALWAAARRVEMALIEGELTAAQAAVGHLVSRDTAALGPGQVASAAVESVAENFTDSVVAPLLWFVVLGPTGAIAYRAVNTQDAMVGYHGRYEYIGKAAARLDDVLNYVPARLGGLLLVAAAPFSGANGGAAWRTMLADHRRTESPNAGWTMSAMAGALGVRLEKIGHYVLGDGLSRPTAGSVERSLRVYMHATALLLAGCFLALAVLHAG